MVDTTRLIQGKSSLRRLVGIETNNDGQAEFFTQNPDGSITSTFSNFRVWVLSNKNINGQFRKLDGGLHYQWGIQFGNRQDFSKAMNAWRNEDTYTCWNPTESMMLKDGMTYYKDLEPKDVSVLSFDLETTGLDPNRPDAKVILISNTFRDSNGNIQKKLFSYDEYKYEGAMLVAWSKWVCEKNPSILTGWNIFGFDLNYLINRASNSGVTLDIGRDGSSLYQAKKLSDFRIDGSRSQEYFNVKCYGREIIDGMFLAYRYDAATKKYDNYKLKTIVKHEGLEKEGRTFYDAAQIRFNYKDPIELEKIKAYCIDDSDDSLALFDLMCPAYFYLAQSVPRSFQHIHQSATGALINGMLVRSYLQDGHSIPKASPLEKLEGGISFAVPGVYRNVLKVDLRAAYPSQVLRFKLYDEVKDPKGHFYYLVKHFTEERFHYKKMIKETGQKKWKDLDAASKVYINSAYGTCSTNGLNFNSPSVAAKITLETRNVIDMSLKWASGQGKDYWIHLFKEATGGLEEVEDE